MKRSAPQPAIMKTPTGGTARFGMLARRLPASPRVHEAATGIRRRRCALERAWKNEGVIIAFKTGGAAT